MDLERLLKFLPFPRTSKFSNLLHLAKNASHFKSSLLQSSLIIFGHLSCSIKFIHLFQFANFVNLSPPQMHFLLQTNFGPPIRKLFFLAHPIELGNLFISYALPSSSLLILPPPPWHSPAADDGLAAGTIPAVRRKSI